MRRCTQAMLLATLVADLACAPPGPRAAAPAPAAAPADSGAAPRVTAAAVADGDARCFERDTDFAGDARRLCRAAAIGPTAKRHIEAAGDRDIPARSRAAAARRPRLAVGLANRDRAAAQPAAGDRGADHAVAGGLTARID